MTIDKVWGKLRANNKEQYRQFQFCVGFAVMLITSYLFMLFSPLVQRTLPEGGDSRKQVSMIFFVAAVGCMIFVVYATGLFLRYKSREVGLFLALGMNKSKVNKLMAREISKCIAKTAVLGIASGGILALLIGKIFEQIAKKATAYSFAFTMEGLVSGMIYVLLLIGIVKLMVSRFMKKVNILDILNTQRKQEPLKKMITLKYLIRGVVMIIVGVFFGYILPIIVTRVTHHFLSGWTNLSYLLVLLGLYQVMVYSISCHRRGSKPQKYYDNLVSYGMLKFQGRSLVRNMLVITLLIVGGLFAVFYIPLNNISMHDTLNNYEAMFSYCYTEDAKELAQEEVEALAKKYDIEIKNYREAEFLQVIGSGINRDNVDKNNTMIEAYKKKYVVYDCISASQYEYLTGQNFEVADGTYYMIQSPNQHESIYDRFDDMDLLYLDQENTFLPMKYAGDVVYQCLVIARGFEANARFVISNKDYERIKAGTAKYPAITQVLFNSTRGKQVVSFANELYKQYAYQISDSMNVISLYDAYQAELAAADYSYNRKATYDPENPVKESDWKYEPNFQVLKEHNGLLTYSIYLLLFLYVAVICLAAVGIVSYARSQSVGLNSKQVFLDLEKLGANHAYLVQLLKKQLQKVYTLPTVLGSLLICVFEILLLKVNDGVITKAELGMIPVMLLIVALLMLYQYCNYSVSVRKVTKLLGL